MKKSILFKSIFITSLFFVSSAFANNPYTINAGAWLQWYERQQNVTECLEDNIVSDQCKGLVHQWTQEVKPAKFFFVNVGDILVPIQIEEKETVYRNLSKAFEFSFENEEQGLINATNIARGKTENTATRNYRPTLFITIHGASLNESGGSDIDSFQNTIMKSLRDKELTYNAAIWTVNWDSTKPNRRQVKMLRRQVKSFLDDQVYAWDVVIVGFSRGAIFANELALQLDSDEKVNYLYTVLLDPTAATSINDRYPEKSPSGTLVSNHLFYDGIPFLYVDFNLTEGDQPISGYPSAVIIGSNHTDVPAQYIDQGYWDTLFNLTETNKTVGNFNDELYWSEDIVRIRLSDFEFDIDVDDGLFTESNAGQIYFTSQIYGEDGNLHVGNSVSTVASMYASIGDDGISARADLIGSGLGFNADIENGIEVDFDGFGVIGIGVDADAYGSSVEFEILDKRIKLDSHGDIEGFVDPLGNLLNSAGEFLSDPFDLF